MVAMVIALSDMINYAKGQKHAPILQTSSNSHRIYDSLEWSVPSVLCRDAREEARAALAAMAEHHKHDASTSAVWLRPSTRGK